MKAEHPVSFLAFVFAFTGFTYGLVVTQVLAVAGAEPVLWYPLFFGLFLAAFEAGRLFSRRRSDAARAVFRLLKIESGLTFLGVPLSALVAPLALGNPAPIVVVIMGVILISGIAFLKGVEVPLLRFVLGRPHDRIGTCFALGWTAAAWLFVLALLPFLGLTASVFLTGALNAAAGMALFSQREKVPPQQQSSYYVFLYLNLFLLVFLSAGFLSAL